MPWDKKENTIAVSFPTLVKETAELTEPTKREVLRTLASVFDPLGIAAPILLTGRTFFVKSVTERYLGTKYYCMT